MKNNEDFENTVQALTLAAPFFLATFFRRPDRCIEMSMTAMRVLRQFGFQADVKVCGLLGDNEATGNSLTLGLGPRDSYDAWKSISSSMPSYEEYLANIPKWELDTPKDKAMHMIVDARNGDRRRLIDLTLAQVRVWGPVPFHLTWEKPTWFVGGGDHWWLRYVPHPKAKQLLKHKRITRYRDLKAEKVLNGLICLAMECENDWDRFSVNVKAQFPAEHATAIRRLTEWGAAGGH